LSELNDCENDIYFVFSAQEEVGCRGISAAVQNIKPDFAFAVDVSSTFDSPCGDISGYAELGKGVAIKIADSTIICHSEIIQKLEDIAIAHSIPYQLEIMHNGTDAGIIQRVGLGTMVGGVGIPARYIHSAVEVAEISDVTACVGLIMKIVADIKE